MLLIMAEERHTYLWVVLNTATGETDASLICRAEALLADSLEAAEAGAELASTNSDAASSHNGSSRLERTRIRAET